MLKTKKLPLYNTTKKFWQKEQQKKRQLTTYSEWAKHLRKYGKRSFWKPERKAGKELVRKELVRKESSEKKDKNL